MTTEAEIGIIWSQAMKCRHLKKLEEITDSPSEPLEETSPTDTLSFNPVRLILDFRHPEL